MHEADTVQLAVEVAAGSIRLVRVAGRLTPGGAQRVVAVVDAQCRLVETAHCAVAHVVVDLSCVSWFDDGALEVLVGARSATGAAGIALHIAGYSAHLLMLPVRARQVLTQFSSFPTAEVAVMALSERSRPGQEASTPAAAAAAGNPLLDER
jgi:anti-anti-sigma regulatory factor